MHALGHDHRDPGVRERSNIMASISRDRHVLSLLIGPLLLTGLLLHFTGLAVGHAAVSSAIIADGTMGTTITQTRNDYTISGGKITGAISFIASIGLVSGRKITRPSLAYLQSRIS
jgi:hypothetical protein